MKGVQLADDLCSSPCFIQSVHEEVTAHKLGSGMDDVLNVLSPKK